MHIFLKDSLFTSLKGTVIERRGRERIFYPPVYSPMVTKARALPDESQKPIASSRSPNHISVGPSTPSQPHPTAFGPLSAASRLYSQGAKSEVVQQPLKTVFIWDACITASSFNNYLMGTDPKRTP